jgi:hypothetical protein
LGRKDGSKIGSKEAFIIAGKLDASCVEKSKHTVAFVVFNGIEFAQFGIRRGSKSGHPYIPKQLHISETEAMAMASCAMTGETYFQKMKAEGHIPDDSTK